MQPYKISCSSELMTNYKQAELMAPDKKFEALQTAFGLSLLFSVGTDDVFYVTSETNGHETGWHKTDLSTAIAKQVFPGARMRCKTFEAAQSAVDGSIGLALVLTDGRKDHLFLCLGNPSGSTDWLKVPAWLHYPFDNPDGDVVIAGVFLSETSDSRQYIVVDILRHPDSPEKLISRYYIDTRRRGGTAWQPHDVAIDLEAGTYSSALGRPFLPDSPHQPTIDGLYTCGQVVGRPQFTYQPLYNQFDPTAAPRVVRLQLPGGIVPDTIATSRRADLSTDLFATGGSGLYYFAPGNQNEGSVATSVMQHPLLHGVRKLYAWRTDGEVIVWGLNGADEIFYTSCPNGQEAAMPSAWSHPVPIASGVESFSPYLNVVDNGNTFFAVAGNTLRKFVKSPHTKTWSVQSITLPAPDSTVTQSFSSYTSHIEVRDENNLPVADTEVLVSVSKRAVFYVNHLYYVLDGTPVPLKTDASGTITLVEWVNDLTATRVSITNPDSTVTTYNPMDAPMGRNAALNTKDSLRNAQITAMDGSKRPLVPAGASDSDLQAVANANRNLAQAYSDVQNPASQVARLARRANPTAMRASIAGVGGFDVIWAEAGDLFNWLKSGVEAVVQIIKDAATDVWHFVVTIAGQVYAAVLETAEAIAGAVLWVYRLIKTAIEDLIKFLEFLFEWQDILVTHRVLKNVFLKAAQHSIDSLSDFRGSVDGCFRQLESTVSAWAGIPTFDQTPNGTTAGAKPLPGQNGAPANLGIHHFKGNASAARSPFTPVTLTEAVFQDLMNLLEQERDTLSGAYHSIKTNIVDQFGSLSITQIIQRFAAIVANTLLETAQHIIDAVLAVFIKLSEGLIDAFAAPLDIPVLSPLYKMISGGEELSFLDLTCLIAAIPVTVMYKAVGGNVPFRNGDEFTDGLLGAASFEDVQRQFFPPPPPVTRRALATAGIDEEETPLVRTLAAAPGEQAVLDETRLKMFGFVTGICATVGSVVMIFTSTIQKTLDYVGVNPFPKTLAAIACVGNVFYVSPNIATMVNAKTANWYQQLNNVLTGISLVKGLVNIPLATVDSAKPLAKVSPAIESLINLVWNVPVIMNIVDNHSKWNTKYKSLIPESIGNFAFNIGGILEFPIMVDEEPESKVIMMLVQDGLMATYGICMPIAGSIYQWEQGQDHS
ncbi:hypothetical protein [Flaviaesturariibacter amylovorans]